MNDSKLLIQAFFKGTHDEAGHYRMAFEEKFPEEGEELDNWNTRVEAEIRVWDCYHQPVTIDFSYSKADASEKAGRLEKLDDFIRDLMYFRYLLARPETIPPFDRPKGLTLKIGGE